MFGMMFGFMGLLYASRAHDRLRKLEAELKRLKVIDEKFTSEK